jgi:HlyD family secretion protein
MEEKVIKKYGILGVILVLVFVSAILIYNKLNPKKLPPYLVEAVGSVDAEIVRLNTKYPGRIKEISVDVGDEVKKGEVVAKLSSKELNKKLLALNSEIKAKENELKFTSSKILNSIKEAKLNLKAKELEIKALNTQISSLQKIITQDKKDEKRLVNLVKKNLAKEHELEMAKLKTKLDKDKLKGLLVKKEALRVALNIAKHKLDTAISAKNSILALENGIKALKAKRDELKVMINDLSIKSPIDGFIDTKLANVGEVIGAGMGVVSIIDLSSYYVKIYVDEITNGKIKLGDKAVIFLDSFPNKPIKAVVSKIAKKAEFTPKEVAVRSDRITRVYEVRLKPIEKNPYLKVGLPAVGVILVGEGELPKSLNEIPEI